MAIKYTITNYSCPKCGKRLKQDNEGLLIIPLILLFIATAGTIIFWFLSVKIINKLYRVEGPRQLGNKTKECPRCEQNILISQGMEWIEFNENEQKCWSLRRLYWWAIVLSGVPFIGLIGQFLWFSSHQGDRSAALAFLFVFLFSLVIQAFFYLYWKNVKNRNYIEVSRSDFSKISSSLEYIYIDVLYWKERFGEQAQILEEKSFELSEGIYNHINIYSFPYDVAYNKLILTKYLIRFKRSYYIAYRVKIYSPRIEKDEMYLSGRFWGFPEMIKVIKQSENKNDFMLENTLLEISKCYKQKEKAFEAFYDDSEIDLRSFFNDIFGDG